MSTEQKPATKPNLRKSLIIDKNLQYQIIGIVVICGAVVSLTSFIGLQVVSNKVINLLESADINADLRMSIVNDFNSVSFYFIALTAISMIWAWACALYLSNRIIGPLYNISRTLDTYLNGDKSIRIKIRRKDFFKELVDRLNRLMDEKK